ncbi:MAG: PIN domain-containing protein [Actinomycetota bacterium]|nr:PIN domain-containing protein [Actinomycetota bacterium]
MKNVPDKRIITDTSVWIEFLKGKQNIFPLMEKLMEKNYIIAVECIFGELLQGVKTKREEEIILGYWEYLPKVNEYNVWINAGIYSNRNRLTEKGVGLIDSALVVLAIRNKFTLWTLDRKLKKILPPEILYY